MRKKMILALTISFLCFSSYVSAGEIAEGMGNRAVRGIRNLFTGILEVPFQIGKGYTHGVDFIHNTAGSKTVGTILGFFRGLGHAGGRMSSGAVELFGFWAVSPENNEGVGVPLDAEYAWEEGTQYSIFKPDLKEGIQPIFNKLGRGLGNGFLGIVEVPGQIKKGAGEGNVLKGTLKGFWYWGSRGVYGLGDIMSCLVPNPVDNLGVHFEEERPWDALSENNE